jgi:ribosomal protein L11 methyltransferase
MMQVSLWINRKQLDQAEQVFYACGALSISIQDAADTPIFEPSPAETPLWPHLIVTGLFGDSLSNDSIPRLLRSELDQNLRIELRALPEKDWVRTSLEDVVPMRFGNHLWICPTGHSVPDKNAVIVHLDPGLAFGTGSHPTTALCLEWLATQSLYGTNIIDYGCGSGVLAIAALKLGAQHVWAVDIDVQARQATRENAFRNAIPPTDLDICHPDRLRRTVADILVANILSGTLIELKPVLSALIVVEGRLVMSGLLANQIEPVIASYGSTFKLRPAVKKNQWILLEGTRVSS